MQISDTKLREIVDKWIDQKGAEGTISYIKTGDYPADIKKRALSMVEVRSEEELQGAMAENGDLSDLSFK